MRIFTILSSNTLLIKRYVHAMKKSSNMQYSTLHYISQDDIACQFLLNLFLPPWRWRRYFPPKRRFDSIMNMRIYTCAYLSVCAIVRVRICPCPLLSCALLSGAHLWQCGFVCAQLSCALLSGHRISHPINPTKWLGSCNCTFLPARNHVQSKMKMSCSHFHLCF
jgi:hypothetical protein